MKIKSNNYFYRASGINVVVEQIDSASNLFNITRDYAGRITQMQYPNKDKSITDYDAEGRILKHVNYYKTHRINKFEFTLDNEGNKMTEKTNIGTRNYGYDDIYQLTSAAYEREQAFTWNYDSAGNRTYSSMLNAQGSTSKTYIPNNLNQYVSTLNIEHGTLSNYSYDADGNLLSDGMRSFTLDVRNRLVSVVNGTKTVDYKYDHNDLRVEKTLNAQSSTIKGVRP
ncbi:MAG: hypothetical protein KA120_07765 [Candidatus Goldbacteria bacterium]|nr:hypothetical protein [Candidatus Goldiibacteriota bacterium]